MRLFALPVALAALAFGGLNRNTPSASAATAADTIRPPPLVLLVHGRGLLGRDSAAVRREWKENLDAAFDSLKLPPLRDSDIQLAYYADVLDPRSDAGCGEARNGATADQGLGSFARDFLTGLTAAVPADATHEVRGMLGDLLYLVDPWKRCAAERPISAALARAAAEGRPVIVLAHSFGAVVAYRHLSARHRANAPRIVRLITVGSLIGVPHMRELLVGRGDLATPEAVGDWVNVYDPDDLFAAPVSGSPEARVYDRATQTPARGDPHDVGRYLRDPATARALAEAWCAASSETGSEMSSGCARF